MKLQTIPDHVCSPHDEKTLQKTVAKQAVSTVGVYIINGVKLLMASAGIAFTVALDIQISGTLGEYFFTPISDEDGASVFGTKTILAATLLTVVAIHLASMNKEKSPLLAVIDRWAPRCAVLFLIGLSLLLFTTMAGDVALSGDSGWEENTPAIAGAIEWLQGAVFEPLGGLMFALGFACVIFLSAFALSKFLEWWIDSFQKILHKIAFSKFHKEAAQNMKECKKEYRLLAAQVNDALSRKESDQQTRFALMVYQVSVTILKERRAQLNKRSDQFASYQSVSGDDVSAESLKDFEKQCSFEYLLAAVKGGADHKTSTSFSHTSTEVH